MRHEPRPDASSYEETTALIQELDALKQRGSNLLVVGSRMPAAHEAACRQFLGETTTATATRRRLFVLADPCTPVAERLPAEAVSADRHSVLRYEVASRSAAETPSGATPPRERRVEGGLGSLGTAVSKAIAEFEASSSGLTPAELRLCFDSLSPLLSEYDSESMFRFLHLLTHRVRSVDGMAHYHLATERDNRFVSLLEPLFDAVVELRLCDGALHQRWWLRDSDLATGWLQL